jgi:uncharacterized protein
MRRVTATVPAPSGLGTPLLAVPEGAPVTLELRLEAVMEGVLVSGTATARVAGECARCLDPMTDEVEVELRELFAYPDRMAVDAEAADDDIGELIDDHADLEPAVRDALVLSLPLSPRCAEDCPGLCVDCGARLADVGPDHTHESSDPRWAALAMLDVTDDPADAGDPPTTNPSSLDSLEKD